MPVTMTSLTINAIMIFALLVGRLLSVFMDLSPTIVKIAVGPKRQTSIDRRIKAFLIYNKVYHISCIIITHFIKKMQIYFYGIG